jgi:ADP-dependent NAD(P)H-hydrate dehydratase / NAD(P)H-hydrate epimerase
MEAWLEPVYDATGMRAADAWAIEQQRVPSLELMEMAGAAVADVARSAARPGPARVVCGKGNNGGDGLVAARHLADTGYEVEALLVWPADQLSADATANLGRFDGAALQVGPGEVAAALEGAGVVVDAIFGTGFSGAPRAPADAAIEAINRCGAPVVAADIASGVDASTGEVEGAAVDADVTVTFHRAKLGHWIAPGKAHTGELRVAEIGIPAGAPGEPAGGVIADRVLALAPRRAPNTTKFDSGQVLVVGGSQGLTGAVCMAAEAAIRVGAGYATVAVPADLEPIFEVKLTEVMSRGFAGAEGRLAAGSADAILEAAERAAAVVLGPGLGRDEDSLQLARALARRIEAPLLIDADGLNAHAEGLDSIAERPAPTVLTPHAGELGRLLGRESREVAEHRLACVREAAKRSRAIVVLKGDDSLAVDGRRLAISAGGSPGLATAGTGDVLSGTIGALLARGMEPFAATCAGVHAHQRAGRIAARRLGGAESVIATDVIAALPAALEA